MANDLQERMRKHEEEQAKKALRKKEIEEFQAQDKIKFLESQLQNEKIKQLETELSNLKGNANSDMEIEKPKENLSRIFALIAIPTLIIYYIVYTTTRDDPSELSSKTDKELITAQFNPLYGDHYKLKIDSQNSLTFPDTYEHIETKYWDNKESKSITVKSYFNGKNAFGVPQRQCLIATYSYSGSELKAPEVCF